MNKAQKKKRDDKLERAKNIKLAKKPTELNICAFDQATLCGVAYELAGTSKPKAELWEAEFNGECVEKHRNGMLRGVNLLTGDQGNDTVLDEWIKTSGGNFDVVVDESNCTKPNCCNDHCDHVDIVEFCK